MTFRNVAVGSPRPARSQYNVGMSDVPDELWRYEDDLKRYAQYLCRHREDAEDVAHNALLKAAEHSGEFRGEASMRTWLHTIVTNECRMLRRRKTSLSLDEDGSAPGLGNDELPGNEPDPTYQAEEGELRHQALSTLQDMPDHYRTALFLQLALRKSTEEIAEALGKSVPATKSILYRARASMRQGVATYMDRDVPPIDVAEG